MAEATDELGRIGSLSKQELRTEWHRHFRSDPLVGLSRDLLLRAVAYKVQEREQGGLSQRTRRTLQDLAERITNGDDKAVPKATPTLKPGVRLMREWRGRGHSVLVIEDGSEYEGERYRSLSEIARRITGARWSGPRFFGLGRMPTAAATAQTRLRGR